MFNRTKWKLTLLKVLVISGSQRANAKSSAVSLIIQQNVLSQFANVESDLLDLSQFPCLLDHYGNGSIDEDALEQQKAQVLAKLYACDAVVIVAPEWGGMIPPALVNLLLLTANGSAGGLPLGHKPAFAIGVSASGAGSNPISLLKAYAAKNSHLVWLPLHAIVQNVNTFVEYPWEPQNSGRISQIQSRIAVGLKSLIIYAEQLKSVRHSLVTLSQVHPFGQ